MNDQLRNAALAALVRHALVSLGTLWAAKFSETEISTITGAAVAVAGVVWSLLEKKLTNTKTVELKEDLHAAIQDAENAKNETAVLRKISEDINQKP